MKWKIVIAMAVFTLANYLSANDYFKSGQNDQAVQELLAAGNQPIYQDYAMDYIQNAEEAYRAAGYSEVEAKVAANNQLLLPQLAQLRQAGSSLVDLATSYRQSGDETSAQAALQMAASLGQRIDQPDSLTLIQNLVGNAIQQTALKAMDPNSAYGNSGQTVQNQLDAILQEKATFKAQAQQLEHIQQTLSEQDWINYSERVRLFGSQATIRWAIGKFGQP